MTERPVVSRIGVEVHDNLRDSPFSVHLNRRTSIAVFNEVGIPKQSQDINIVFKKKIGTLLGDVAGQYIPWRRQIDINPMPYWKERQKNIEKGREILETRSSHLWTSFYGMCSQERLKEYLKVAPKDRASKILEKLADSAMQRGVNETFLHESKHASDFVSPIKGIALTFATRLPIVIGWDYLLINGFPNITDSLMRTFINIAMFYPMIYFSYKLSLDEIRARRFADKTEGKPQFRPIKIVAR